MTITTIPGYPRIGARRELKRALEGYWSGRRSAADLDATAAAIRADGWRTQAATGLDLLPVNDFSLYDQMLDTTAMLGAIPDRFGWDGGPVGHDLLFAMARGRPDDGVAALELTKWFDTNYHYLVPELTPGQTFRLSDDKPLRELGEATAIGFGERARVCLIGPLTWLSLAKRADDGAPLDLLDRVLPVYAELVDRLAAAGAPWIAFDESILATDVDDATRRALATTYGALAARKGASRLLIQVCHGTPGDAYADLIQLPVDAIGLDLVRGTDLPARIAAEGFPDDKVLVAGVVDGRNIWTADLGERSALLSELKGYVAADRLGVSTSTSLLHVPYDLDAEDDLPGQVRPLLAFGRQKLDELEVLRRGLRDGASAIADALTDRAAVTGSAAVAAHRARRDVRDRVAGLPAGIDRRPVPHAERATAQRDRLGLPPLPTTTIGSFPQTPEIRTRRLALDRGEIDAAAYDGFLEDQIRLSIERQVEVGLDVLVHGEPERNDMVQYFGEQLDGFAFTRNGWVQSYGSRCVRPPIIYGDVARPAPMTVRWATFAQSLTERPVKGMLTGPVTMLNWSFVRDDQPRSETCLQLALAIRDEVTDLEAAGIAAIQIDEPALREGLPLRRADHAHYLDWSTRAFRVAAAGARADTQIHTHMCYAEFNEIIDAIEALDADVLSVENARSGAELLDVFRGHGYDKGIGPGVYDIHSPAVPTTVAIAGRLRAILATLPADRVWVNPDCGLKTRRDREVWPALTNMVAAAREVRAGLAAETPARAEPAPNR